MSNADTNLLSGLVENEMESHTPGFRTIKLSGEPYANAMTNVVVENYNRITGRERPSLDELTAKIGEKITLLRTGENMLGSSILNAIEGKLFESSRGGLGILPKGARSKGFKVDEARVVDVLDGYSTAQAQELTRSVRECYPELQNLTKERLEQLPGEGTETETLSLALLGEWRMPDSRAVDAIWLIGEYWPEDDICDRSVLLIRPEHGFSEHGSCYGRQLLQSRALGEIVGFPGISFRDAFALCDIDFDEASKAVFDLVAVTA